MEVVFSPCRRRRNRSTFTVSALCALIFLPQANMPRFNLQSTWTWHLFMHRLRWGRSLLSHPAISAVSQKKELHTPRRRRGSYPHSSTARGFLYIGMAGIGLLGTPTARARPRPGRGGGEGRRPPIDPCQCSLPPRGGVGCRTWDAVGRKERTAGQKKRVLEVRTRFRPR